MTKCLRRAFVLPSSRPPGHVPHQFERTEVGVQMGCRRGRGTGGNGSKFSARPSFPPVPHRLLCRDALRSASRGSFTGSYCLARRSLHRGPGRPGPRCGRCGSTTGLGGLVAGAGRLLSSPHPVCGLACGHRGVSSRRRFGGTARPQDAQRLQPSRVDRIVPLHEASDGNLRHGPHSRRSTGPRPRRHRMEASPHSAGGFWNIARSTKPTRLRI